MANVQSNSGALIAISEAASNSALADAAAFAALTWVNIPNIGTHSGFGDTQSVISYPTLADGNLKAKGRYDAGTGEIEIGYDDDDTGHTALEGIADQSDTDSHGIRITYPNGDIRYCRGICVKNGVPGGGDEDFDRRSYQFGLNQNNVYVNAA